PTDLARGDRADGPAGERPLDPREGTPPRLPAPRAGRSGAVRPPRPVPHRAPGRPRLGPRVGRDGPRAGGRRSPHPGSRPAGGQRDALHGARVAHPPAHRRRGPARGARTRAAVPPQPGHRPARPRHRHPRGPAGGDLRPLRPRLGGRPVTRQRAGTVDRACDRRGPRRPRPRRLARWGGLRVRPHPSAPPGPARPRRAATRRRQRRGRLVPAPARPPPPPLPPPHPPPPARGPPRSPTAPPPPAPPRGNHATPARSPSRSPPSPVSPAPRPAPEALMRILVAEDEPRISRFIARGLTASGYMPTVVDDGIAALDHASSGEFDL